MNKAIVVVLVLIVLVVGGYFVFKSMGMTSYSTTYPKASDSSMNKQTTADTGSAASLQNDLDTVAVDGQDDFTAIDRDLSSL